MSDPVDLGRELDLALTVADLADRITAPAFERRSFTVEHKSDLTEVTEIDRLTETAVVDALRAARPGHGVFGEEHGRAGDDDAEWQWVVDPIDGTTNFVRGVPVWATLIALVHLHDGPVVGVVSAPALGRRWWSARGVGAFADGRPISVSRTTDIAEAHVSVTFNEGWERLGLVPRLVELQNSARRARGFGDFWQHMLVAEGAIDVAVDAIGLGAYDNAAIQIIVEEAGGRHTDRFGTRDFRQDSAVSTNGLLHTSVIESLRP